MGGPSAAGLGKGKTVDATTLEAKAAMRSIEPHPMSPKRTCHDSAELSGRQPGGTRVEMRSQSSADCGAWCIKIGTSRSHDQRHDAPWRITDEHKPV